MENLFICYKKCSTCSRARKWLEERNISFEERDIKEDNPSAEELAQWIGRREDLPIKRFFNTSGMKYRELNLKERLEEMTEEEKIQLLAQDGMLVKRPLLITKEGVVVGFKEKEWEELFS